jgi:predicted exporter
VKPRVSLLLFGLVLVSATIVVATNLTFGTNVTNLMPAGRAGTLADVSRRLTNSELSRHLVLTVHAPDPKTALAGARELADAMAASSEVAWVRTGVDEGQMRAVYELYFPRRHYFVSEDPARIPELTTDTALRANGDRTRRDLALPTSPLLKRVVAADPLGAFRAVLERFQEQQPALDLVDGQFVSKDGLHAVIFLGTHASGFDGGRQKVLLADLERAFAEVNARHDGTLTLEKSGPMVFAVAAEQSIRGDVNVVALFSIVAVFVCFHLFFRSRRNLLLTAIPMLSGLVVATGLGVLVFGQLDGLTLGFGAALIGVVIDYPTHLLCHLCFSPHRDRPRWLLRRITPSLVLGGLTTVASFAGLGFTTFPGFQQIAFFSGVGVSVAIAVTLWVLPPLVVPAVRVPAASAFVSGVLGRAVLTLGSRRKTMAGVTALLTVLSIPLLSRLVWVDDLTKLFRIDPGILEEDQRVHGRVTRFDTGRFVIGLAPDRESALELGETVAARLAPLVASHDLEAVRSIRSFLWSEQRQRANLAALRADPTLPTRVRAAFQAAGFRANAFDGFEHALATDPPPPLTFEDLAGSPLGDLVRPLLVQVGDEVGGQTADEVGGRTADEVAVVTYLQGVRSPDAVRAALAGLAGVHFFDQKQFMNDIYGEFRTTTLEQLFIGNGLVIVLLLVRYRRVRPALAAFFPSILVALVVLALFAALRVEMNLLHVVGLVMVTGMGVDYGVFVVDSAEDPDEMGITMLSVFLGSITTVFTFGVLSISQHPALRALGVTIGGGIFLSFVFAPLALLLLPASKRPHDA